MAAFIFQLRAVSSVPVEEYKTKCQVIICETFLLNIDGCDKHLLERLTLFNHS